MDILFISEYPPFPLSDDKRSLIYHLAKEFSGQNWNIDLISFYDVPEAFAEIPRYERFFRSVELFPKPQIPDTFWKNFNNKASLPQQADDSHSPELWRAIQKAVKQYRPDIIHLVGQFHLFEYQGITTKYRPTLFTSPKLMSRQIENLSPTPNRQIRQRKMLYAQLEQSFYAHFDTGGVMTPTDRHALVNDQQKTIVALPYGVDTEYYVATHYAPPNPTVLFIGDFGEPAIHDAALRLCQVIFPNIQRNIANASLLLVGKNPSRALHQFASQQVIITGRVPDLRPYIEQATIFINPIAQHIGFQTAVLKVMAMGIPVVGTPEAFAGIRAENQNHVLMADDDAMLIRQSVKLLKEPRLRQFISQNATNLIQDDYTWSAVGQKFANVYQDLIRYRQK